MSRVNMLLVQRLLLILGLGVASAGAAAAESEFTEVNDAIFTEAVIQQVENLRAKQKSDREDFYNSLREQFPDLLPPRSSYPSLRFYNQTFDSDMANTVFFAPGSSYISDVQQQKLRVLAASMGEAPETSLIIEGHSSFNTQIEEGERRLLYNRWISGRRAVAIWNFMTKALDIDPNRVAMFAYDSQRPLNGEESETEKALNRRVEMRLSSQPIPLNKPRNSTSPRIQSDGG